MKDNYLELRTLGKLLSDSNIDTYERRQLINMYETYKLFYNYFYNSSKHAMSAKSVNEKTEIMDRFEDRIYTIGSKTLNDKQRILLELETIKNYVNNNKSTPNHIKNYILKEVPELERITSKIQSDNNVVYKYLKKKISLLQAYLGIKNRFFSATVELFEDKIDIMKRENQLDNDKLGYRR